MKYIFTISIILLNLTSALHCGSALSTFWGSSENQYDQIRTELIERLNTCDYSGINEQDALESAVEKYANKELGSDNTPKFNNFIQSIALKKDQDAQDKLGEFIVTTSFEYVKTKCTELGIGYKQQK